MEPRACPAASSGTHRRAITDEKKTESSARQTLKKLCRESGEQKKTHLLLWEIKAAEQHRILGFEKIVERLNLSTFEIKSTNVKVTESKFEFSKNKERDERRVLRESAIDSPSLIPEKQLDFKHGVDLSTGGLDSCVEL